LYAYSSLFAGGILVFVVSVRHFSTRTR